MILEEFDANDEGSLTSVILGGLAEEAGFEPEGSYLGVNSSTALALRVAFVRTTCRAC